MSRRMRQMVYVGLDPGGRPDIRRQTALVQPHPTRRDWVQAQFDRPAAINPALGMEAIENRLDYRWHTFHRREFRERNRLNRGCR